jgi:hypothetical protein
MNDERADKFIRRANSLDQWHASARSLKACADLIFGSNLAAMRAAMTGDFGKDVRTHLFTGHVFFLLAGLAIENLAKGLLVQRGGVKTISTKLAGDLKTHGIRSLLKRLKISLSPEEEKLVNRLEHAIIWAGRYPVPIDAAKMLGTGTLTRATDGDEFTTFYERLSALLSEKKS